MIDRKQNLQDEENERERKPELEAETLKDLTPPEGSAEAVKGGETTMNDNRCGCETM